MAEYGKDYTQTFSRHIPGHILPVIVFAQFACTSLWFAGNAVLPDLQAHLGLEQHALGWMTSSVQFGFIVGTLIFAILTLSDRFSPSRVFFLCAMAGGGINLLLLIFEEPLGLGIVRFFTGACLAGIYPVGMKIASDYHEKGLGKALGYLLGALVLGTASPHILRSFVSGYSWQYVLFMVSGLSLLGGFLIFMFVPDGPFRRHSSGLDHTAFLRLFRIPSFRFAALGYFGHMWELYAFWAFVPLAIGQFGLVGEGGTSAIALQSFAVIAIGALSCIIGGYISLRSGSAKVAFAALLISGLCCLFSAFIMPLSPWMAMILFLVWGMAVIADSPQFSTLVANAAPTELKGSGLTIMNCIGFSITIISIQLLNFLQDDIELRYLFFFLLPGPILGLIALSKHPAFRRGV